MEDKQEKQETRETPEEKPVDVLDGFDLDEEIIVVRLAAEQKGKVYSLKHHLRVPTAKQWKEYQGNTSKLKAGGREPDLKDHTLAAREKLWGEIVVRVEGYIKGGKPLACEGEDWKRRVWVIHKGLAISELIKVWQPEGDEKNSGAASED